MNKYAKSIGGFILEILKIAVISLAIIVPVRYFLIQPFFVRGDSMEPNFSDREYLIIDEISYRFKEPERGEIIVFKYPKDPDQYYIKRIMGLPGERIFIEDGELKVYNQEYPEGMEIDESTYLPLSPPTPGDVDIILGENEYFMMGDNRRASSDSRSWGPVNEKDFIGRTWLRLWPMNKAMAFELPDYTYLEN